MIIPNEFDRSFIGESMSSKPGVADTLFCLSLSDLFKLEAFLTFFIGSSSSGSSSSSMVALDGRLEVRAGGGREPLRINSVDLRREMGLCSKVTEGRGGREHTIDMQY
jgi:hypothetical protein